MSVETRHVRYVFADVVEFTQNRTLEAQVEIIGALNTAFIEAVGAVETVYLPTGDGICAAILQVEVDADVHLQTALRVLELFYEWSSKAAHNRSAQLRIAINESVDAIVTDINGNRNLAGVGINSAQRLMTVANGNQVIAGRAAYETLNSRDRYANSFRMVKAEVKHGGIITAYQFTGLEAPYLNTEMPSAAERLDPIDLQMAEDMEKPGGYSNAGMRRATYAAADRWEGEIEGALEELAAACTEEQRKALTASQKAWKRFNKSDMHFIAALRETVSGSMYGLLTAEILKSHVRDRTVALRSYLHEWLE